MENDKNEEVVLEENNEEETIDEEPKVEDGESEEKPKETLEAKQARLARQLERVNKQLGKPVEKKEVPVQQTNENLTSKDLLALMQAQVPADDMEVVTDYAKYKGISVADALKSSIVRTELTEKSEERKTAQATSTGAGRRSSTKTSDESLLNNLNKGEIPDNDADLDRLLEARYASKKGAR